MVTAAFRGRRRHYSAFDVINTFFMLLVSAIMIYPMLYVLSMSVSSFDAVQTNKVTFYPIGFSLKAYEMAMSGSGLLSFFANSVFYAAVGSVMHVGFTMLGAYPLSFENFCMRKAVNVFILVTMFFSGGIIPFFLLIRNLNLYNTRWAILLPGLTSAWSIIIARIYIKESIGLSLIEAARIDGGNDFWILLNVVMPISMPILAYLGLTMAVSHWNSYFNALLFLPDRSKQPLQIYLMRVIIQNTNNEFTTPAGPDQLAMQHYVEQIKYAVIIIATMPILFIYPFLQKHFVKGIMVGALK